MVGFTVGLTVGLGVGEVARAANSSVNIQTLD